MIVAKKRVEHYYPDIYMNTEYEVVDIRDYLYLKDNKRHYQARYFRFFRNGNEITQKEAKMYLEIDSI